jgi:hypothetical protein
MRLVYASGAAAAAAFTVGMTALGASQDAPAAKPGNNQAPATITLEGCVQRESDYRRATGSGSGGAGFGVGLGNEYVLINAVRAGSAPAPSAPVGTTVNDIAAEKSRCGGSGGEAFELTGAQESELRGFAGRRVRIVGVLKPGKDAPVGTSGTETRTDTTGLNKLNPFDQDLNLKEVEITSFSAVTP